MDESQDDVSLFAVAVVLLRWRRLILGLGMAFGLIGLIKGLTSDRLYKSTAIFVPQGAPGGAQSGLAAAASQLGISIPSGGVGWGPTMYVELVKSRAVLAPVAYDTVVVAEEGGRRVRVMDLLTSGGPTEERRVTRAAMAIADLVSAAEEKRLAGVKLSVTTKWPSVSKQLVQLLLDRLNRFNIETRKSQAVAERRFVEEQTRQAEQALREAEGRLGSFLQRNRAVEGSPPLRFERDRLEREVSMLQTSYSSWVAAREEARIREIRDTPMITVLEEPLLPFVVEPRRSARKAILGGVIGGLLAVIIAFAVEGVRHMRRTRSAEAREFFALLRESAPRFLRR